MAGAQIKGEGVILSFLKNGSYEPFGCARSTTLNLVSDTVGKSTIGSGDWKEKEVVALDWNFTIEGIIYMGNSGNVDAGFMYNLFMHKATIQIQFFLVDETGTTDVEMTGTALITSVTTTGSINNTSSLNITGEGTGALWSSTNFQIINVAPGPGGSQTTLTFNWDEVTGATAYTISIRNITTGVTIDDTGGNPPRNEIVLTADSYAFALKWEPTGTFGPEIFWP